MKCEGTREIIHIIPLPIEEIARTIDVPKRIGDGKSIGYDVPSSSVVATSVVLATGVGAASTTVGSTFGSAFFCDGNVGSPTCSSSPSVA